MWLMTVPLPQRTLARGRGGLRRPRRPEPRPPGRRLPLNEATRPYAGELLRTLLAVLAADGEEAGLVALRTAFEINKAFRAHLEEHVPAFLEVVRKVGPPRAPPGAARACRGSICRRGPRWTCLGPGARGLGHAARTPALRAETAWQSAESGAAWRRGRACASRARARLAAQAYESAPATFRACFEAGPDAAGPPAAAASFKVMVEMPLQGPLPGPRPPSPPPAPR